MNKQSLIKGSLVLALSGILARFLGLFFRWPIIMLIGDEGVGLYQMSYPIMTFFIALSAGVPVAISKIVSENNAVGNIEESFKVVKSSTYLMLVLGIVTTGILFFFAKPIIHLLKWDMKAYYGLIGVSFAPLVLSIMTIYRGFFQGLQNMTPSAISQILEQAGRVVFGVGLAVFLLPLGMEYAAGGAAFGAVAGGMIGGAYLMYCYKCVKKSYGIKKVKTNPKVLDKIIKMAAPISLAATVGNIMTLIDSFCIPQNLLKAGFTTQEATILYAQLTGKAAVIVSIPMAISMALCVPLVPIIAEKYILKKKSEVSSKVEMAFKLIAVVAVPCVVGIFVLAEPVMKLIFHGRYEGFEILRYMAFTIPFVIIAQATTSILQGIGHYKIPVVTLVIGCIIKVIITMGLVVNPKINIFGAIVASVVSYIVIGLLNVMIMKRKLNFKLDVNNILVKPIIAALIMGGIVNLTYKFALLNLESSGISCLISIFLGIIVYITLIMILKVFKISEIMERIPNKFKK